MGWRVLAIAVVVLVAGCSGFSGGGAHSRPAETVTPAPVPAIPAEGKTPPENDTADSPPGLSRGGELDVGALSAAHADAVRGRRYVWASTEQRRHRGVNGTVTLERSELIAVEDRTTYRRQISRPRNYGPVSLQYVDYRGVYADGGDAFRYWKPRGGDEPSFKRTGKPRGATKFAPYVARQLAGYLPVSNVTVVRVSAGGETYYRVAGSRSTVPGETAVTNYTARALVGPDGFVWHMHALYEIREDGDPVRVRYTSTYSAVGTANVRSPAWLPTARGGVSADGAQSGDGTRN